MARRNNHSASSEVAFESSESSPSKSKSSSNFPSQGPSPLINSRSLRKIRGANIQKLLAKENLEEEADEFWQRNKYFGEIDHIEETDEEEYEKESSIKDVFDEDFISEPEEENQEFFNQNPEDLDEKNNQNFTKHKNLNKKTQELVTKKSYIHEFFSQEELLKEAALTEILNKKSLEDLVRLEEEKKKKNLMQKILTDSPKMKMIDSYKSGVHQKTLYFSDEIALETEMEGVRNKENKEKALIEEKEEKNEENEENEEENEEENDEENEENNNEKENEKKNEKKKKIEQNAKKHKYKDPESGERFTTMEEMKILRKKVQKEKKSKLKFQIKAQKSLLEKKQQALISLIS